jgi:hypothetical protein
MSTFKVKLHQGDQGSLDTHATNNSNVSIQRTVYVMGPHKTNRKLVDGTTFTDSNYWKRFAYPQVTREQAFIEVVTDDGSVYVDGQPEVGINGVQPVVYNFTLAAGSTYAVNTAASKLADVATDYSSHAIYTQITTSTNNCKCKINGSAVIDLNTTSVQVFNPGDLDITKLEFQNDSGGNSVVQILMSVAVKSNS